VSEAIPVVTVYKVTVKSLLINNTTETAYIFKDSIVDDSIKTHDRDANIHPAQTAGHAYLHKCTLS